MSTAKRNLREVLDARRDLQGIEVVDASSMTGFTTQIVNYVQSAGESSNVAFLYYSVFKSAANTFPTQDGVTVGGTANAPTAVHDFSSANVGLRHYHQQMQAMKGVNFAGDLNNSSPSQIGSTLVDSGITPVFNGSGNYRQENISMGNMRGFVYPTEQANMNLVWPSSGETAEHLINTGEISIGSTS